MKKFIIILLIFLCGCSSTQIRQEIFGMNRQDVEMAEKKFEEVFDLGVEACFDKILKSIKDSGANVHKQDRKDYFIVAYQFNLVFKPSIDTTEVGILLKPGAENKTRVIVASGNYYLAQFVSGKLFKELKQKK